MIDVKIKGFNKYMNECFNENLQPNYYTVLIKDVDKQDIYYVLKSSGSKPKILKNQSEFCQYFDGLTLAYSDGSLPVTLDDCVVILDSSTIQNFEEIKQWVVNENKPKEKPTQKLQENIAGMVKYPLKDMAIPDKKDLHKFLVDLAEQVYQNICYSEEKEKEAIEKATVKEELKTDNTKEDKPNTSDEKLKELKDEYIDKLKECKTGDFIFDLIEELDKMSKDIIKYKHIIK